MREWTDASGVTLHSAMNTYYENVSLLSIDVIDGCDDVTEFWIDSDD